MMQRTMQQVQMKFKFGKVEDTKEFKFCGRTIAQDEKGVTIQCPNVLDRTKPIYIQPQRRKQRGELATPSEVNQMRSVVGSLSWLARVSP